ncbi:MAG TPA: hypothetical protein VJG32_02775 [Anaerolineae bacterium]|nr:hypothetical protein [Anaerolineae bacterium]
MSETKTETETTTTYCFYHPNVPTSLRCNRCGKPICPRDAVRTPVGYRCKDCVRQQQNIYFTAMPIDYVIAALVALPVGYVAQLIVPRFGFFIIFIGPAVGGLMGEIIWRASRKRRGRYTWIAALGALSIGALAVLWPRLQLFSIAGGQALGAIIWDIVFFVLMAGSVVARLRFWR